jgi:2-dehydro-3-deoxygluconokinase
VPDLVTLGEAMGVVRGVGVGVVLPGAQAQLSFAGAEATVAIGVSRLGHSAAWAGRVGDDAMGDMILRSLRGEDVDVSHVLVDPVRPTGLMLRHRRTADVTAVAYYRRDQAGAGLSPGDLPGNLIDGARVLHVTGITPALGEGCAAAVSLAVAQAKDAGATVSLDVNYRALLWPPETARPVIRDLVAQADVVFAGEEEAVLVTGGAGSPEDLARRILELGPGQAVIKLGSRGALAMAGGLTRRVPALRVSELDPIGAGDAFVAGYLSAVLDGENLDGRLSRAAACGAFAVAALGDWEGLPRRGELSLLGADDVLR